MRRLKLVARPPELGPLIIRYPLLYRAVPLCLFAYGLLMLGTDIGHVRGECCSRSYLNDDPAIEFSSLWVCGVAAQLVFVYRKIVFVGNIVRVSWLGGAVWQSFPVESLSVREVESESRSGEKTVGLSLKLGRLPVSVSSGLDGYEQLRSSLRDFRESD